MDTCEVAIWLLPTGTEPLKTVLICLLYLFRVAIRDRAIKQLLQVAYILHTELQCMQWHCKLVLNIAVITLDARGGSELVVYANAALLTVFNMR